MCFSVAALVIGTALSVGGTLYSAHAAGQEAQAQAEWQNYQLEVQNDQLKEEQEMIRLQAQETEAARMKSARQARASNMAMLAASGATENFSFTEGADKANDRTMRQDLATLRLNSSYQINRIANQIFVNKQEGRFATGMASMKSSNAMVGGLLESGAKVANAYNTYDYYRS
jgi:hypothetical protein